MTKNRILNLISICMNVVIVILVIVATVFKLFDDSPDMATYTGVHMLKFFTNLSNIFVGIMALIMIPFEILVFLKKENEIPLTLLILKYVSVVAVMVTFITTACFLAPTAVSMGNSYWSLFAGSNLILHLIVPLLAMIVFSLCETKPTLKFRYTPYGVLPVVLYGIFYTINCYAHIVYVIDDGANVYDWYGFMGDGNPLRVVMAIIIFFLFTCLVCLLVWFCNTIFRHMFNGYDDDEGQIVPLDEVSEPQVVERKVESISDVEIIEDVIIGKVGDGIHQSPINSEEIIKSEASYDEVVETYTTNTGTIHTITKKVKKQQPVKTSTTTQIKTVSRNTANIKTSATRPDNKYKEGARTYHISRHIVSNKWQVKLAHGEKAIKLFATQKEAIDYAKALVKTQGGSIRIHSMKGKIRK